jgi:hypothetical protein
VFEPDIAFGEARHDVAVCEWGCGHCWHCSQTIKDPDAKKPEDWDERPEIEDPEDKKPEGWDDEPAQVCLSVAGGMVGGVFGRPCGVLAAGLVPVAGCPQGYGGCC